MRRSTSSTGASTRLNHADLDRLSLLDVGSQRTLDAQQVTIARLQEQNNKLRAQLQDNNTRKPPQQSREGQLKELLDVFNHKLQEELRQVAALEKEVDVTQAKVAALRKSTAGQLTPNEQAGQVTKHIQMLEGRLEKSLAKFSETLSGNKVLRDEIEQLHKELTVLQELHGRHSKELQLKKDELADLHRANRLGGEAAQEAKAQAAALHVLDEKEQQLHEQEVAELEHVQAAAKQLEEAEGQQKGGTAGGLDGDRWGDSDEQIQQMWGLLQVACGCSCREDVIARTTATEEQNYALFETCSRANQSVSQLQQDMERLRGEIQQLGDDQEYVQSKSVVKELQQAVESLRQRSRRHEEKAAVNRKSLLALQPAVASLAGTVGLPPSQVSAAGLDIAQGLLQHLGSIETRARLIVMVYTTLLTRQLTAS